MKIYEDINRTPILRFCKKQEENVSERNSRHFPLLLYLFQQKQEQPAFLTFSGGNYGNLRSK